MKCKTIKISPKIYAKVILKALLKISLIVLIFWIMISFLDFALARSMYGGMHLSKINVVVVIYKVLDNLLKGFIF